MKAREAIRAGAGVLLCMAGFFVARSTPYRETTVMIDAGGCRMVTDVVDAGNDATQGYVVLLHGLAANKKIMSYLAGTFAEQNLRVFVPDLPGHGRTQGPFSYAHAEACSESFLRQLIARGAVDPARTILVGHSMGGAIAFRVGARVAVAAVIAISPAPMTTAHGVSAELLPYTNPPPTPVNTLTMSAAWEPGGIRESAQDLIAGDGAATGKYQLVPRATHVSMLFDSRVARASQDWVARALHLTPGAGLPSEQMLVGCLTGLIGLLLLAGPFLRETVGANSSEDSPSVAAISARRLLLEVALASAVAVVLLHFWNPSSVMRVFEGGYLATFLFIVGVTMLLLHLQVTRTLNVKTYSLLAAAFAAVIMHLLITGWFELCLSEAWLTATRWLRFPGLLIAVLPYHAAEELLLGSAAVRSGRARLALALLFRLAAWGALLAGLFLLHSGAVLLVLLAPYLAVFCLLQRLGMDVVRKGTGSPLAAALFGAILLAGFCLVIFPIT